MKVSASGSRRILTRGWRQSNPYWPGTAGGTAVQSHNNGLALAGGTAAQARQELIGSQSVPRTSPGAHITRALPRYYTVCDCKRWRALKGRGDHTRTCSLSKPIPLYTHHLPTSSTSFLSWNLSALGVDSQKPFEKWAPDGKNSRGHPKEKRNRSPANHVAEQRGNGVGVLHFRTPAAPTPRWEAPRPLKPVP